MQRNLVLIANVLNESVTEGFVPAGIALGYDLILVTDHKLDYMSYLKDKTDLAPIKILECDVFNPIAVVDLLLSLGVTPDLVFSNSDHLQSVSALVADYFQLPGKHWGTCYRTKNKSAMRCHLRKLELPSTWSCLLKLDSELPNEIVYPVIAKPCEGVASQDVSLCRNHQELAAYCQAFFRKNSGMTILIEGFIEGALFTLETLGDGEHIQVIGGFDVVLSAPPHFVELEAQWNGENSKLWREEALAQVEKFGVGFGVCHSEFIATKNGPVLIEINYRSIGDGREFLLDKLLPFNWFETILELHSGKPLSKLPHCNGSAMIRYFLAKNSGHVAKISDNFSVKEDGVDLSYRNLKQVGDWVQVTHSNKDYLGRITAMTKSARKLNDVLDNFERQFKWEVFT